MKRPGPASDLELSKRPLLKISEIARLFSVSVQAVHLWIATGRVRRTERTSKKGTYLVPREEVARLLAAAGREVPGLWEYRRPRVLLIDDDRGIRKFALAAARSSKMPLSLRTAESVEDGLLLAAQFGPDVILLDTSFAMGGLRGDQGLAFIRGSKLLRTVRVVAMVDLPQTGEGMLRGGADAILLKPFSLSELRDAIVGEPRGSRGGPAVRKELARERHREAP